MSDPTRQTTMRKLATRNKALASLVLAAAMGSGQAIAHGHHGMAMAGHWMAPAKAAKRRNPVPATPVSLARGEALFQAHCAACHGKHGEGDGPAGAALNPPPADLKAMSAHHSDGDLAWKTAHGRGAMPAWKGILKPKQIWDLVNHMRWLQGRRVP